MGFDAVLIADHSKRISFFFYQCFFFLFCFRGDLLSDGAEENVSGRAGLSSTGPCVSVHNSLNHLNLYSLHQHLVERTPRTIKTIRMGKVGLY